MIPNMMTLPMIRTGRLVTIERFFADIAVATLGTTIAIECGLGARVARHPEMIACHHATRELLVSRSGRPAENCQYNESYELSLLFR